MFVDWDFAWMCENVQMCRMTSLTATSILVIFHCFRSQVVYSFLLFPY